MTIIEFPLPAGLINLNDRKHWSHRAALSKEWRTAAFFGARVEINSKRLTIPQPASYVQVILPVTSLSYRRDPHNFTPTAKAIIDGLVDAGVWPDDNENWVTQIDPAFKVGGFVEVRLHDRTQPAPLFHRSGDPT